MSPVPVGDASNSSGNSVGTSSSSNESAASLISKIAAINYEISGESVFDTPLQESYESGGDIFYAGQWALFVSKISSGGNIGGSSPGGGGKTVSGLKKRGASGNLQTIRVSGKNKTVHTGPQGGKYYINDNGNKTYLNRDGTKRN